MTFEWGDFHKLAEELLTLSGNLPQAKFRSSVSRAYYAAFHALENCGKKHFGYAYDKDRRKTHHDDLISEMAKASSPEVRKAAIELENLKWERSRADYKPQKEYSREIVCKALLAAKKIIDIAVGISPVANDVSSDIDQKDD